MRFLNFKEFRPVLFKEPQLESVVKYLMGEMVLNLRQLSLGLARLSFEDNFEGFVEEVEIAAGVELQITNKIDTTPSKRVILRADEGGLSITDGPTEWTEDFVYLKNYGAMTGTVTVVFLR